MFLKSMRSSRGEGAGPNGTCTCCERASKAVGMAFGMKKCATASMLGGKVIGGRPLPLNEIKMIEALVTEDS